MIHSGFMQHLKVWFALAKFAGCQECLHLEARQAPIALAADLCWLLHGADWPWYCAQVLGDMSRCKP